MPLFQEVCSAVSCTFSPSTCNFLDLIFNFNSLKSLLIQIPPLLDQQEISTEHSPTDLLFDQFLQIQHLSPLACWQHVVQDLGGEENKNEDQTGCNWPKWCDICHSPMIDRETRFEEEKDFPCHCQCQSNIYQ